MTRLSEEREKEIREIRQAGVLDIVGVLAVSELLDELDAVRREKDDGEHVISQKEHEITCLKAELAARPGHTVELWVAASPYGDYSLFKFMPCREGNYWRAIMRSYQRPWDNELFGLAPPMSYTDEPRKVRVTVEVEDE